MSTDKKTTAYPAIEDADVGVTIPTGWRAAQSYSADAAALSQILTSVAMIRSLGRGAWDHALHRAASRTDSDAVFAVDASGLLIAAHGSAPEEGDLDAMAAMLSLSLQMAETTVLGVPRSVSLRGRRRWLSIHRVDAHDDARLGLGFAGVDAVEPDLSPPRFEGKDAWSELLNWSLGPSPGQVALAADASGLLVACEPTEFAAEAPELAAMLGALYERARLAGSRAPRLVCVRYDTEWLTIFRARRSRFRTVYAGIIGRHPAADGRSYDVKRALRELIGRTIL